MNLIAAIVLLFTFAVAAAGQDLKSPSFPDSKEGKRGVAFMEFLNSEDEGIIKSFVENEMTADEKSTLEERLGRFARTRSFLGGSKLRRVISVTDMAVTFIVETRRGTYGRVKLELDPAKESRIAGIAIDQADKSALTEEVLDESLTEAQIIKKFEDYLDDLAAKDEFSGSVIVAKNGKPIFSKAYGFADRDMKVPNKIDTKFNIGSLNKLFTMLSIGILADEGKLSMTDSIGKHIPDYPNKDAREKVTIEHLLTMSSGIGDIFGEDYDSTPKSRLRTIASYLPLFAAKPLAFEPGTDRQYSNGGFLVLGAIIEKASGRTYYDFVRERITKPIGMNDTESYEADKKIANMAEGYMLSKTSGKRVNNFRTRPVRGSSGGGGYSTAVDLLKFANALESGSYKSPEALKKMDDQMISGLANGRLAFGGGAEGINAVVESKVSGIYTIIVMSNFDPPTASSASRKIRGWLDR